MNIFPEAVKIKKRSFAFVWITPVVALFITIWVIYNGFINTGKEIIVQFDSGSNIVEGKTPVKYKGIVVGKVKRFEFTGELDKINVVIQLRKGADEAAKDGMMFWVVKPRLGLNKITGLETILTGTYIEMRPPTFDIEDLRKRKNQDFFIGLSEPPIEKFLNDSFFVTLSSKKDPGVNRGMIAYHNGVDAGQILSVKFDEKENIYRIVVAIEKRFRKYVNSMTKFWNVSRFDMKYDSAGFQIRVDSINTILQGGIAFDTSLTKEGDINKIYTLYRNYDETLLSERVITVHMPETYGVRSGRTPVIFKGIPVGLVTDLKLSGDKKEILAFVQMNKEYEYLIKKNSRFVIGRPMISPAGVKNLSSIVSGVFLGIEAGDGEFATEFTITEESTVEIPKGSIEFSILSDEKGSVKRGAGIYFRGVKIGIIKNLELVKKGVKFCGVIYPEFKDLATTSLYLWQSPSVGVHMEKGRLDIKTEEITRILAGGISAGFFSSGRGVPMVNGIEKKLYGSRNNAKEAFIASKGIKRISLTAVDAHGLYKGAEVLYRGVKVGEIDAFSLNRKSGKIDLSAMINREYGSLINKKAYFWKLGSTSLRIGTDGINIRAPGLKEMIKGGITFDHSRRNIQKGDIYYLYKDGSAARDAVKMASYAVKRKLYYSFVNPPVEGEYVFYRGVKVGETGIAGYDKYKKKPFIYVYIENDFKDTLNKSTRFWKGTRVKLKADGDGINAKIEPVISYLKGSIHYDSFINPKGTDILYRDRLSAEKPDCKSIVVKLWVGHNLKKNAPLLSRGKKIGYVESIDYPADIPIANVLVREKYKDYLREGALFWTENMAINVDGIKNAEAMILGARMIMIPGKGKPETSFTASEDRLSELINAKGLHLVLTSDRRKSLEIGSPVYFRQVQTGMVESVKLSKKGDKVIIGILIKEKFANLVNRSSEFKAVSGFGASFGFFSGFKLKTESVKSVVKGGISFETKNKNAKEVKDGDLFELKI